MLLGGTLGEGRAIRRPKSSLASLPYRYRTEATCRRATETGRDSRRTRGPGVRRRAGGFAVTRTTASRGLEGVDLSVSGRGVCEGPGAAPRCGRRRRKRSLYFRTEVQYRAEEAEQGPWRGKAATSSSELLYRLGAAAERMGRGRIDMIEEKGQSTSVPAMGRARKCRTRWAGWHRMYRKCLWAGRRRIEMRWCRAGLMQFAPGAGGRRVKKRGEARAAPHDAVMTRRAVRSRRGAVSGIFKDGMRPERWRGDDVPTRFLESSPRTSIAHSTAQYRSTAQHKTLRHPHPHPHQNQPAPPMIGQRGEKVERCPETRAARREERERMGTLYHQPRTQHRNTTTPPPGCHGRVDG